MRMTNLGGVEDKEAHGSRAQKGVYSACNLGILASESLCDRSLRGKQSETNHGCSEVDGLGDRLVLHKRQDNTAVGSKEENHAHCRHESLVHLRGRLSEIGAGSECHLLRRVEAHVPAEVCAVPAHSNEHYAHIERVEPVKQHRREVEALESRRKEVEVRGHAVDESRRVRGGKKRGVLCEMLDLHFGCHARRPRTAHGVEGTASTVRKKRETGTRRHHEGIRHCQRAKGQSYSARHCH